MNSFRDKISIGFQVAIFLLIWVVLLLIKGISLQIGWEAIKTIPDVIAIYAVFLVIFVKWAWKWVIFRGWLVTMPILHGTWKGTLHTTWENPETGETPGPIDMYLAIRQTFRAIHITMFTRESVSQSDAASLCMDDERGQRLLTYSYANVPDASVRHRSQIHYGSARLRITLKPTLVLQGEYWTDRKSTGHMELTFVGKDVIEGFPE